MRRNPKLKEYLPALLAISLTTCIWVTNIQSYSAYSSQDQKGAERVERMAPSSSEGSLNVSKDPQVKNSSSLRPTYILWTRWRSGSSFLGTLLSKALPNTFYSFEPLHAFGLAVRKEKIDSTELALRFLNDVINCNYEKHIDFVDYFVKTDFYFTYNPLTQDKCKPISTCNSTQLLSDLCSNSQLQVIKLLRLSLMYGELFLKAYPEIKIIYLARDPRGTLKSRSRLLWCLLKDCHDPKRVCEILEEDMDYSLGLLSRYPDRFIYVRYEDLALNPKQEFKKIWKKLGQTYTKEVETLIRSYTLADIEKGTYALKLNSQRNAFAWRSSLDYKSQMKIQNHCSSTLKKLGYKKFETEEEYENENILPVSPENDNIPFIKDFFGRVP